MNTMSSGFAYRQRYDFQKKKEKTGKRREIGNPVQKIEVVINLENQPKVILSSPREDEYYKMHVCSSAGEILRFIDCDEKPNTDTKKDSQSTKTENPYEETGDWGPFMTCGGSPTSMAFINKGDSTDIYIANVSNAYITKGNYSNNENQDANQEQGQSIHPDNSQSQINQKDHIQKDSSSNVNLDAKGHENIPTQSQGEGENHQLNQSNNKNSSNLQQIQDEEGGVNNSQQQQSFSKNQGKEDLAPPKIYESMPLKGPGSVIYSRTNRALIFSDCGLSGMTSLNEGKGSVFLYDFENDLLRPLLLNCLAGPVDICYDDTNDILYVAELYKNRVLRLVQNPIGVFHCSVFHQFSGRFGPNALAIDRIGNLYVSRYEFPTIQKKGDKPGDRVPGADGLISVLNKDGIQVQELVITGMPEINGMCISKEKNREHYLYFTTKSFSGVLKIKVAQDVEKINEGN